MAVSRWERGAQEPPSHGYIALGNLARDESCWYFWERAGLRSEHILRVLPTIGKSIRASELEHVEIVNAGSGLRSRPEKIQLVAVPLLNAVAGAHGEKGDDVHMLNKAPIESMMAAPRDWCPNPSYTSCLRVRGNSMAPLILNGYIVAIDSSQINLSELDGKIVIAWHKDRGLTVSRFRRYDHTEVLVPENTGYDSVTITPEAAMESGGHGAVVDWQSAVNTANRAGEEVRSRDERRSQKDLTQLKGIAERQVGMAPVPFDTRLA